jgi:RNA polymerase sigma factor (sigma-70 family)
MVTNEAFVEAVTKYTPLMGKFLRKFARNHTEREEIHSILLSELFVAMETHDGQKANFLTHLHNRFRWACCNKITKDNSIGSSERKLPENTERFSFREKQHQMINDELYDKLKSRLNPQAQEVLEHLRSGLNSRETGELMGLSEQRISQIFIKICEIGHKISGVQN